MVCGMALTVVGTGRNGFIDVKISIINLILSFNIIIWHVYYKKNYH